MTPTAAKLRIGKNSRRRSTTVKVALDAAVFDEDAAITGALFTISRFARDRGIDITEAFDTVFYALCGDDDVSIAAALGKIIKNAQARKSISFDLNLDPLRPDAQPGAAVADGVRVADSRTRSSTSTPRPSILRPTPW